jgi:DNA invertase Pin-like site-specific DNA recombinase
VSRIAGYLRVSTEGQATDGYSLSAQESAIRKYCADNGLPEPVLRIDAGRSAYSDDISDRPAFAALMADIEAGHFDTVIVARLDRFARSNLVAVQQLAWLYQHGATLVSLAERWDFATASGRFQYQLMSSLAEFDSRLKSERVRGAIRQKRLAGGYHGQLPFGAKFGADGALMVDPERADALRWLLTEAANRGVHYLAARLTAMGIPTRRGNPVWSHSSVWTFIKSGAWLLDQPDPWPSLFRAARDRPRLPHTPASRGVNLLTGLARCACGGVICYSAKRNVKGERYVECRLYARERATGRRCPHYGKATASYYEAIAERWFLSLPELEQLPEDASVAEARIRIAERRRIAEEIYMDNGDRSAYRTRLAALDAEEAALPLPLPLGAALIAAVAEAQAAWPTMTVAEQNRTLRGLLSAVRITGRDVAMVPTPELAALLAGQTKGGALAPPVVAAL